MSVVWVIRAGTDAEFVTQFERRGIVALGFTPQPYLGRSIEGMSRTEIKDYLSELYPTSRPGRIAGYAGQLLRFLADVQIGDHVVTPTVALTPSWPSDTRQVLYGTITSDYYFSDDPIVHESLRPGAEAGRLVHCRSVVWRGRFSREQLPEETLSTLRYRQTIFEAGAQEQLLSLLFRD